MRSTFLLVSPAEPKNRLRQGVTEYFVNVPPTRGGGRNKAQSAVDEKPPPPPLDIPESVVEFAQQTLAFPADSHQQDLLAATARRVIVCCTRQWGKSTTAAVKVLHHALRTPGSLTLIASRTRRQAGELLEKVITFARTLDLPIRSAPRHHDSLLLPNGSRIIALPGKPDSLRGFSAVSLLIIDEAAYVEDDLYHALRPMLATTNGTIWLLSTPRNRTGFFYDVWSAAEESWTKFIVTADECPRISAEFLEEERKLHGPALYKREYFCDFGYTGRSFFELDDFDAATGMDRHHAAETFSAGRPTTRFFVGFDLGQKATPSALVAVELVRGATGRRDPVTWERIEETHLIFRRIERFPLNTPYDSQVLILNRMLRDLGDIRNTTLLVDATGCGQPFLEILRRQKMGVLVKPVAITSSGTGSFSSGIERVPKKALMSNANFILASRCLSGEPGMAGLKDLREEMEAFRVRTSRAGNDSFRSGQTDDLVMAFALAVWRVGTYLPKPGHLPTQ